MQIAQGGYVALVMTIADPKTPHEALSGPNAARWREAMQVEIDNLIENGTWQLVDLPRDTNVVSNKWVFKVKYDSKGDVEKFKARLVARGFSQQYGVDYTETYSPVIKQQSVRLILALGTFFGEEIEHMDVPQAFVKAGLDTDIYVEIPAMVPGDPSTQAFKLLKSLYGLKQSGRMRHTDIDATLLEIGLSKSLLDPCIYYNWSTHGLTVLGLYVDVIIVFSQDHEYLDAIRLRLEQRYQVKSLGDVKRILGINEHHKDGALFLEQTKLIKESLENNDMKDCHPQSSPLPLDHKMTEDGQPSTMSSSKMREIIGSLQWLAGCTRPDIAFATSLPSRFLNAPNEHHERAIKRILRYLQGTKHYGLEIKTDGANEMHVFTDADWAGDKSNRRSTTGCIVEVYGAIIHWFSKQQATVALSTMEAEYIAASVGTQEALWLQKLMMELGLEEQGSAVSLWCDNQSIGSEEYGKRHLIDESQAHGHKVPLYPRRGK
ncbi:hypothetical protein Ae201684P_002426 [Aphanomyces euteiches]|uniref:Reverse transcriptase Ty1/copia-type domain-containing protein n=1 Tax=Aphanomyces euteiches TaxID=100861 RepID=A0A6G0X235_9STRA|nr:hypothetical protein Ae201684_009138 [Aphanomyces euteiches]KAH9070054.1 hypothetical protein Ae201684P_002426 [Aphanomyces euteiches]